MIGKRLKRGIMIGVFSLLISSLFFLPALAKEDNFKMAVGEINLANTGTESVVVTQDGGLIVYGSGEESILPGFPQYAPSGVFVTSPVLVDLDADGDKDIIVIARNESDLYSLYVYDGLGNISYQFDLVGETVYYDPVKINSTSEYLESFALITESGKVFKYELSAGVLNSELIVDVGTVAGISASEAGDRLYITRLDSEIMQIYNFTDGSWQWGKEITMAEPIIYPLTETSEGNLFAIGVSGQMHKISGDVPVESDDFPVQFDKFPIDSPVVVDVLGIEQNGGSSEEEVVILMSDGKREIVSLDGNKLKQDDGGQNFVNLGTDTVSGNTLYTNIKTGVISAVNNTSDFVRSIYTRIKFVFTENEAETQNKYLDISFNEVESSTEFVDISGLNNDAKCKTDDSCPESGLAGRVGNSIELDGVDDYLEVKHFSYYQPTDAVTVEAWVKPELKEPGDKTSMRIIQKGGYELRVSNPKSGVLGATVRDENGVKTNLGAYGLNMGEWNYVVLTYDGAEARLYLNGELGQAKEMTGILQTTPYSLTIGEINGHSHYKGGIDELKIYNRTITEQEMTDNYEAVMDQIPYALELKLNEDVSSTEFTDTSGNYQTATCEGDTCPISGLLGRVDNAIELDGVDDYLTIPNSSVLNISKDISIETWIKPEFKVPGDKTPMYILQKGGYELRMSNPRYGILGATLRDVNSTKSNLSGYGVNMGEWNHVALTYDGNQAKLYVNGELSSTKDVSLDLQVVPYPLTIGQINGHSHYKGGIDDLKIYNRVITAEEIGENYQTVMDQIPYVLELKLDETTSSTEFADTSGNFQIATCEGVTCPVSGVLGRVDQAIEFDGVDDYLEISNSSALSPTEAVTIETWIRPELKEPGDKNPMRIIQKAGYELRVSNPKGGVLGATLRDVGGAKTNLLTYGLNMGQWNHVALTYDGSEAKLYLNGELAQTKLMTGLLQTLPYPLTIGEINGHSYYKGGIDEIKIYNRAVSLEELNENYETVMDQITYALELKLDETTSSTEFADTSGNFQIATCEADACPVSGQMGITGNAIELDGVDDYLQMVNSSALNITEKLTLETWIKPELKEPGDKTSMRIIQKGGYELRVSNPKSGVLGATLRDENGVKTNLGVYGLNMGEWNYVALTYDGAEARLYLNGELGQAKEMNGLLQTTGYPLTIGEINGHSHYKGMIDEVKLHDIALTEEEVMNIYQSI